MFRARAALLTITVAGCTLSHPLDSYSSGPGASDAGLGAFDGATAVDASVRDDAGCAGVPVFAEPADKAVVGATVHVHVSAPTCIADMIIYIDSQIALHVASNTLDASFPVSVGAHSLNVNGWAHTNVAHVSEHVGITRPK